MPVVAPDAHFESEILNQVHWSYGTGEEASTSTLPASGLPGTAASVGELVRGASAELHETQTAAHTVNLSSSSWRIVTVCLTSQRSQNSRSQRRRVILAQRGCKVLRYTASSPDIAGSGVSHSRTGNGRSTQHTRSIRVRASDSS